MKETLNLDFERPNDEEYVMRIESELEKLKAEKDLGWVENDTNSKNIHDKEILNQEIARLNEKLKKSNVKLDDFKKKESDWTQRENKYQTTCKNFKKTISELKKDADNTKKNTSDAKSFEKLFTDHNNLKKSHQEEVQLLYSLVGDLNLENQMLKETRSRNKNFTVDYLESTMKMFDFDEIKV